MNDLGLERERERENDLGDLGLERENDLGLERERGAEMLTISVRSVDFALKLSHFSNFSNLGNILASLAGSGSGAASITEAKHSALRSVRVSLAP